MRRIVTSPFAMWLLLGGCASDVASVEIEEAQVVRYGAANSAIIRIILPRSDVERIADQQMYQSLIVFDCANKDIRYPAELTLNNAITSDFTMMQRSLSNIHDSRVALEASVPRLFMDKLRETCVKLEGGSYLGQELTSNTFHIGRRPARD